MLTIKDSKIRVIRKSQRVKIDNIEKINLKKSNFERKPSNKFVEIIIDSKEIKKILGGRISGKKVLEKRKINYSKYFYGFINVANTMSGSTHSNKIGKLHILFKNRKFRSLNEWEKWYLSKYPTSIKKAVNNILAVFEEGVGIQKKDRRKYRKQIKDFVENLVFNQTYTGLKIQEVILIKMADILKQDYRWGTEKEDSSGIDGFVGDIPISIKPKSSQQKKKAGVKRAYYTINEENSTLTFTFSL